MSKSVRTFRLDDEEYKIVKQFIKDFREGNITEYATTTRRLVAVDTLVRHDVSKINKCPVQF